MSYGDQVVGRCTWTPCARLDGHTGPCDPDPRDETISALRAEVAAARKERDGLQWRLADTNENRTRDLTAFGKCLADLKSAESAVLALTRRCEEMAGALKKYGACLPRCATRYDFRCSACGYYTHGSANKECAKCGDRHSWCGSFEIQPCDCGLREALAAPGKAQEKIEIGGCTADDFGPAKPAEPARAWPQRGDRVRPRSGVSGFECDRSGVVTAVREVYADVEMDGYGRAVFRRDELEPAPLCHPDPGRVYFFAETVDPPARYVVRGEPGVPAHLTDDPLKAARFDSRTDCLALCHGAYAAVKGWKLIPREHMFMGHPETRSGSAESGDCALCEKRWCAEEKDRSYPCCSLKPGHLGKHKAFQLHDLDRPGAFLEAWDRAETDIGCPACSPAKAGTRSGEGGGGT